MWDIGGTSTVVPRPKPLASPTTPTTNGDGVYLHGVYAVQLDGTMYDNLSYACSSEISEQGDPSLLFLSQFIRENAGESQMRPGGLGHRSRRTVLLVWQKSKTSFG